MLDIFSKVIGQCRADTAATVKEGVVDDRPQIGTTSVDPEALVGVGEDLAVFAASVAAAVDSGTQTDIPRSGWRLLSSSDDRVSIAGAPIDGSGHLWQLAQLRTHDGARILHEHPESFALRPSRKARAAGLILRWPDVTRSSPDIDELAIDIVNEGHERWVPQGDSFVVTAGLVRRSETFRGLSFAWIAGQNPALQLDPGEYARVRVTIDSSNWSSAGPGSYEVHPWLTDLGLAGPPLAVELSEEDIRSHRPKKSRRPPH